MRQGRFLRAVLALTLLGVVACSGDTAVVESLDVGNAAAILDGDPDAVLLDIRTPEEFAESRLEGAINIDFYAADFAARLATLDRAPTYVIYCRSGNRTTAALDIFRDLNFTSVHAVDGGILAWTGSGRGVVSG